MTGYLPRHFTLEELVSPDMLAAHPARVLWGLLDPRLLWTIDALRDRYGPLVCNDWARGGRFRHRGLRPHDCAEGARLSDHKYGRAVDLVPLHATAEQIRADVRAEARAEAFRHITVVEEGVSWLHLGFRNHDRASHGILWVAGS